MSSNPFNSPPAGTSPGGAVPGQPLPNSPLAIISLVLGIIAILFDCCCWPVGAVLGVGAIVTGIIGLNQAKAGTAGGKGLAMAGLICGIAAIILGVVALILGAMLNMPDMMQQFQQMQRMQ